jgi:hypothetical protein
MSASARFDGSANVLGLQNQLFFLGPGFRFRIYIDTTWHFIWGWGGKASKHQWAIFPLTVVNDPNARISCGSKTIRGSRNFQRPDASMRLWRNWTIFFYSGVSGQALIAV